VSIARTFKAVAWSFFGVRKGSEYERDIAELKPQHVVAVGIVCAALFVGALVVLVKWIIGSGIAAG
jgi:preprotein translocase subunit Sec61beta